MIFIVLGMCWNISYRNILTTPTTTIIQNIESLEVIFAQEIQSRQNSIDVVTINGSKSFIHFVKESIAWNRLHVQKFPWCILAFAKSDQSMFPLI